MALNLDRATFGNAPAALYLALLLNERGDRYQARKIAKILQENRELLHDVAAAHLLSDELSARSLSKLLVMIDERMKRSAETVPDLFIRNIVINILTGEIRVVKARCLSARNAQKIVLRDTPQGSTPTQIKAVQLQGELGRAAWLQEKSRKYLARKSKQNTLY